jgi:hypothetical protein
MKFRKVVNQLNMCDFLLFAEFVSSRYATKSANTSAIVVVPISTGLFQIIEYTPHASRHATFNAIIPIDTADPGTL